MSAFEIVGEREPGPGEAGPPFIVTCEHATNHLPEWEASAADAAVLRQHWGWDIGAADVARGIAARAGCPAILSRFSRLVADPNRRSDEPSFVVTEVEGRVLDFNRGVDGAERARRYETYARPYHDAIDAVIRRRHAQPGPFWLLSVHSFTPDYRGERRGMEVGVLFDDHDAQALRLEGALRGEGFRTALNEPYSGKAGLIHAAQLHGENHTLVYLEIEVRQDLIDEPKRADAIAARLARAVRVVAP